MFHLLMALGILTSFSLGCYLDNKGLVSSADNWVIGVCALLPALVYVLYAQ